MKILFLDFYLPYLLIDSEYPVGGWTNQLHTWLHGMKGCDCEVGVLTWRGAKQYVNKDLHFKIIDTYEPKKGIKFLRYFYLYIPTLLNATQKFAPDIIIQSSSGLDTGIMAYIANTINVPFIYRVASDRDADDRIYKTRIPFYTKLAYRYGLHKMTASICQNQYQHDALQNRFSEKKHYIFHNQFHTEYDLPPIKPRHERLYIAWVGIFKYEKNLPFLLQIAQQFPDISFKIAGMRSKHIDQATEDAIESLNKLPNVDFVGFVKRKDIFSFLSNAILLLSTSHYEGFSNVLLEAMAVGVPLVTPERIDPDRIITKNNLGFAPSRDSEIPDCIKSIVSMNAIEYKGMAVQCKQYVHQNHDPVRNVEDLLLIMKDVQACFHAE